MMINRPYGLQEPTNSGQPMTSQILVSSTVSIQAVAAGTALGSVTVCPSTEWAAAACFS